MAGSVVTPSCNARFVAAAVSKRAVTFILLRPQYRHIYPSRESRAVRVGRTQLPTAWSFITS
jgi:hypothetical protein